MDFSKIPFLKNLDMTNPQTKKSVIMLGVAVVAVIVLLVLSFSRGGDKGKDKTPAESSSIPPIQLGEDKDKLEGQTIIDLREKRRNDNGDFARRMFEDAGNFENMLSEASDSSLGSTQNASNQDNAPSAQKAPGAGKPKSLGSNVIEEAMRMADEKDAALMKQLGISIPQTDAPTSGQEQTSRSSSTGDASIEEQVKQKENEIRAAVRAKGYDPDTNMPLRQDSSQESTGGADNQVQKPTSASAAAQEGVEKSVVSIRGRGSMSSFGSSPSSSAGSGFSSFGSAEQEAVSSGAKFFRVAFAYTEKVKSGQRVILRTKEKITVDGYELPINSIIYANCSISEDRLMLSVHNVDINGKAYYLNYAAVDIDWEDGLYCPSKRSAKKAKEVAREAGQLISQTLSGAMGGFGGRVISSGASMVLNSNGDATVTVMEGYEFYLVPAPEKNY